MLPVTKTDGKVDCKIVTGGKGFLAHRIRISEILTWNRKSYVTNVILPRPACEGCTLVVLELTTWSSSDVIVMLK